MGFENRFCFEVHVELVSFSIFDQIFRFSKKVKKVNINRKAQKWKEIASRGREHGFFIFELKKSRKSIFRVQRSIYMTNPYMHLKAHEILDMGEVLNTNLMTEK